MEPQPGLAPDAEGDTPGPLAPEARKRPWTILGRLSQAVREQNWFAVVLELAIVVLGVVIGFQVTAWGNDQAERAREQVLLRGLRADFVENRAKYEQTSDARDLAIRRLRDLHALLGSGQIALVRSDSLQTALASWPTVLANMEENERMVVDGVIERVIPYLASRYPLAIVDARAGLIEPARPNTFPVRRRALLTNLEFANLVEDRWVQTEFAVRDGEPVRQLIEDILRLIDADLDP